MKRVNEFFLLILALGILGLAWVQTEGADFRLDRMLSPRTKIPSAMAEFIERVAANEPLSRRLFFTGGVPATAAAGVSLFALTGRLEAGQLITPDGIQLINSILSELETVYVKTSQLQEGENRFFRVDRELFSGIRISHKVSSEAELRKLFGSNESAKEAVKRLLADPWKRATDELRGNNPDIAASRDAQLERLTRVRQYLVRVRTELTEQKSDAEEEFLFALSHFVHENAYDSATGTKTSMRSRPYLMLWDKAMTFKGEELARLVDELIRTMPDSLKQPTPLTVTGLEEKREKIQDLVEAINLRFLSKGYTLTLRAVRDPRGVTKPELFVYRVKQTQAVNLYGRVIQERLLTRADNLPFSQMELGRVNKTRRVWVLDVYEDLIQYHSAGIAGALTAQAWIFNVNQTKIALHPRREHFIKRMKGALGPQARPNRIAELVRGDITVHERGHVFDYLRGLTEKYLREHPDEYRYYASAFPIYFNDPQDRLFVEEEVIAFLTQIAYGRLPYYDLFLLGDIAFAGETRQAHFYAGLVIFAEMFGKKTGKRVNALAASDAVDENAGLYDFENAFDTVMDLPDEEMRQYALEILQERYGLSPDELRRARIPSDLLKGILLPALFDPGQEGDGLSQSL